MKLENRVAHCLPQICFHISQEEAEVTYLYNFHYGARVTGSESTHFDVWRIVKMLLRNS
jgi:hypothetical protein